MKYRQLPRTDLNLSEVGFGLWTVATEWGGKGDDADKAALLENALEKGINFFDTADTYGEGFGEEVLAKVLGHRRKEIIISTKFGYDFYDKSIPRVGHQPRPQKFDREFVTFACEQSLRRLQTDYIDLYQLHSPQPQWSIEETMGTLLRLRDQGKIRYIGISNYSAKQTVEAVQHGVIHSSQPRYNMLNREAEESILPACLENGIGVIPHSVLAKGHLSGRYKPGDTFDRSDERSGFASFTREGMERVIKVTSKLASWSQDHGRDMIQLAIAWTLAQPSVTSPIVGAKSAEQVCHNALAADWKLSESDLAEIDDILRGIRVD